MIKRRRNEKTSIVKTYHSLEPRLLLAADAMPVDIVGTEGVDIIRVFVESDNVRVSVNNTVTDFDPLLVDKVVIDGLGFVDHITIIDGAAADNQAIICPDSVHFAGVVDIYGLNVEVISVQGRGGTDVVQMFDSDLNEIVNVDFSTTFVKGAGFEQRVTGFEEIYVNASTGFDQVFIKDTAGEETLIAGANDARMFYADSFVSFSNFDYLQATSTGGNDLAALNGSDGSDGLFARPDFTRLFVAETNTTIRATGFARIVSNGGGGSDHVDFFDSAGNDTFYVRSDFANLTTPTVVINAGNYENVVSYANNGGRNVASILDTPGSDSFFASEASARLIGLDFSATAINFDRVDVIASEGNDFANASNFVGENRLVLISGNVSLSTPNTLFTMSNFDRVTAAGDLTENDTAFMLTSLGNDEFFGSLRYSNSSPTTSALLIGDGMLVSLTDFVDVKVVSAGGVDSAFLSTTDLVGKFEGSPAVSSLTGPNTIVGLTKLRAESFNKVIGSFSEIASEYSRNFATIDGSGGEDQLYATEDLAILTGTLIFGEDYSIIVNRADHFSSNGNGGNDSAILRDTIGFENVSLKPDVVAMSTSQGVNNGGYEIYARNYNSVNVISSGGFDEANFTGSNGNDIFFADSRRSTMRGDGYVIQGVGFERTTANALSGPKDIAYLYDSPGNDTFTGDLNRGTVGGPGFVNTAIDFDEVHAVAFNGGSNQFIVDGVIFYRLFKVGDWFELPI